MTITTPLHPAFLARMQEMLSAQEYTAFLESFNAPRTYGPAGKHLKNLL